MKRRRIDHLPVVDNGILVGIITSSDIMKVMSPTERIGKKSIGINNAEDRLSIEVSGLGNDDVITASVDESLQGVCDRMISAGSSCIIKVWDEIQGIITYRDIVALLGEKVEEDIPMFIVGLPDEPLDAELAKSKFANITKFMREGIHPDIEQVRCHIKLRRVLGSRKEIRKLMSFY